MPFPLNFIGVAVQSIFKGYQPVVQDISNFLKTVMSMEPFKVQSNKACFQESLSYLRWNCVNMSEPDDGSQCIVTVLYLLIDW